MKGHLAVSSSTMNKSRKPFAISLLVVIIWFAITGVFGPLFGKLTSVQENNNSSFLPKGAEATLASDQIAKFSGKDSFNFPTLILFEGKSTPETFAAINAHLSSVGGLTLDSTDAKIADYLAPGQKIINEYQRTGYFTILIQTILRFLNFVILIYGYIIKGGVDNQHNHY